MCFRFSRQGDMCSFLHRWETEAQKASFTCPQLHSELPSDWKLQGGQRPPQGSPVPQNWGLGHLSELPDPNSPCATPEAYPPRLHSCRLSCGHVGPRPAAVIGAPGFSACRLGWGRISQVSESPGWQAGLASSRCKVGRWAGIEAGPFLPLAPRWASSTAWWGLCRVRELPALLTLPPFFVLPALADAGGFFPLLTSVLPQYPVLLLSSYFAMQPTLCIKFPPLEVLVGLLPTQLDPSWTHPFLRTSECSGPDFTSPHPV